MALRRVLPRDDDITNALLSASGNPGSRAGGPTTHHNSIFFGLHVFFEARELL